jgi:hypothetical protein
VTQPPVTPPPVTEPPVTPPPVTQPPVTEPPVTEPPVTEPPVTPPPVTEPPVTEPPVTEPPVTEPPVTEPPVTPPPVTEPPVTEPPVTEPPVLQLFDPPFFMITEIMDFYMVNTGSYKVQDIELFYKKPNVIDKKELKILIYTSNKEPFTLICNDYYDFPKDSYIVRNYVISGVNKIEQVINKTFIVAVMEDSNYIDAVCLKEKPDLPWSDEYKHLQDIMVKLGEDNVWKSKENRIPDYRDCIDTSSIEQIDLSVNRREGVKLTRTVDDWYIAKKTRAKQNNPPPK